MDKIKAELEKIKTEINASKKRRKIIDEECLTDLKKQIAVTNYMYNAPEKISELAIAFEKKTKLTGQDVSILFVAIGLQIIRQFLQEKISLPKERLDDQAAAGEHEYSKEERNKGYYNPSLSEILTKPVPFDVVDGADGKFKKSGKFGHRGKTLGHDPLLGLIFGTANIATATVTLTHGGFAYESYHVRTNERNRDSFAEHADTIKVLKYTVDKIVNNTGNDGRERVAVSFAKEIIHLKSDIYSKNSLPLPLLTTISPELAGKLAKYGIDCANLLYVGQQLKTIGKQAGYAIFINYLVSIFHKLFFYGNAEEEKLYEVRTRKIIMYSNAVATAFNLGLCGFAAYKGEYKKAVENLDIGGLGVTVYRIITDPKFIDKVRHEFVIGTFEKELGELLNY